MPAGYSSTPLAKKLGVKEGHTITIINEPDDFRKLLKTVPDGVRFDNDLNNSPDIVIVFNHQLKHLEEVFSSVADAVFPDNVVWLAWPKKSSGVETDLSGDVVRATVLATKLVDVKVCAISEIWSGLKVVWRKEHR